MMQFFKPILLFSLFFITRAPFAKDFIIFSVGQNISMGEPGESIQKNYYVNFGENQGIQKGDKLNVYRIISRLDPYKSKVRFNFKVLIGQIKVLHTEANSSITKIHHLNLGSESSNLEIENFMIGDHVSTDAKKSSP